MNVFYSDLCVIGEDVLESVDRLIANGAENIELMMDGQGWNDFHLHMDVLANTLRKKNVSYSIHTPVWDINLTSENAHMREAVMETYRQSIVFSHKLQAKHVVIHPGFCYAPAFDKAVARARAHQALESLLEFNKVYGQQLLIENVGTCKTSIFTQDEFSAFLNGFPKEIGYLIDIGHAFINGWNFEKLFNDLGERLIALHIHDNDGKSDAHLPIGEGSIDWNSVFAALPKTRRDLHLVLEYNIGTPLEKLAEGKQLLAQLWNR